MAANLTPMYKKAEQRYRQAGTPAEEVEALEEMLREVPKHKGTEKLQADLKRRLSAAREKQERGGGGGAVASRSFKVPRNGLYQVALVGPPNSGRSALLSALTRATPEVAAYPFTTRVPQPGVVEHRKYRLQLVEMPAVSPVHMEPWVPSLIQGADAALLVCDLGSDDVLSEVEAALELLAQKNVHLVPDPDQAQDVFAPVPTLLVGSKADDPDAALRLELLQEVIGDRGFATLMVSAEAETNLDALMDRVIAHLDLIRVYTRKPGARIKLEEPFIIRRGETVLDLAEHIHKDIAASFKTARLWEADGSGGQYVSGDYVIQDEDVIEIDAG